MDNPKATFKTEVIHFFILNWSALYFDGWENYYRTIIINFQ